MRRASLLALALVLVLSVGWLGPASAQRQDDPASTLSVRMQSLKPLVAAPDKTLRLAGRLTNNSGSPVTAVQVRLLLSASPLTTRGAIGDTVAGLVLDGPPTQFVSSPIPVILGNAGSSWELSAPLSSLPLASTGVYVLGVEAIGTTSDGITQRLGITRTFLPWFPDPTAVDPSAIVWLWPVTAAPARALEGLQVNDDTAAQMADGGRLRTLIENGGDSAVSWLVDPAVVQTADDMSDGYFVRSGDAATEGTGDAVATQWLADIRDALGADRTVYSMPYANPDLTGLQRAGLVGALRSAVAQSVPELTTALRADVIGSVTVAPGGNLNQPTLRALSPTGTSVLLSDSVLPPEPALSYTPDGTADVEGRTALVSDAGLSAALAMPQDTRSNTLIARQRMLAEAAMITAELPDTPRTVIASPDWAWSPRGTYLRQTLRALQNGGYSKVVPLQRLLRESTTVTRTRVPFGPEDRLLELPESYFVPIKQQRRQANRLRQILSDQVGALIDSTQLIQRQSSVAWRDDRETGEDLLMTSGDQLDSQISQVRIVSAGTFTLPGDTGRIPVTVGNDLAQDVTVDLSLRTDLPARLTVPDIEPFVVPAGRKVSVEVEARVIGSGSLPVDLQLMTPKGRDFGEPVPIEVRTTAYSQAAGYVVVAAFAVLTILLALNFVRRRRMGL